MGYTLPIYKGRLNYSIATHELPGERYLTVSFWALEEVWISTEIAVQNLTSQGLYPRQGEIDKSDKNALARNLN